MLRSFHVLNLTAEEVRELLPDAKSGAITAIESLIASVTPFVIRTAGRYALRHPAPLDDLIQVGLIGVLRSIPAYDPNRRAAPGRSRATWKTFACAAAAREIARYAMHERQHHERWACGEEDDIDQADRTERRPPRDVYVLRHALAKLPRLERAIIDAIHGLTRPALSWELTLRELRLAPPRARRLYNRGRERLKSLLYAKYWSPAEESA